MSYRLKNTLPRFPLTEARAFANKRKQEHSVKKCQRTDLESVLFPKKLKPWWRHRKPKLRAKPESFVTVIGCLHLAENKAWKVKPMDIILLQICLVKSIKSEKSLKTKIAV